MVFLSIVIPVRNRYAQLKHCLRTLSSDYQETMDDVEVIVVDYGGTDGIQRLVESYGFKYVYTHNQGMFCKTHALNIGLKVSTGEYVANIDADMILQSNFIAVLLREAAEDKFVLCRCWHLPKMDIDDNFEYFDLKSKCTFGHKEGIGACQMASRSVWLDLNGQDESIVGWGSEDWDVVHRMRLKGMNQVYIHGKTSFIHQDHYTPFTTPYKNRKLHEDHDRYINEKIKAGEMVRNVGKDWGIIKKITPIEKVNKFKMDHSVWRNSVWKRYKDQDQFPLISIVIPSVRADRYIARIIENVKGQKYPNIEVVICSPTDKITTKVRKHCYQEGIVLVDSGMEETNLGQDLNTAIQNSRGLLITKMDDDDIYFENYLMDLYMHLMESKADMVGKAIGALFVKVEQEDVVYSKNMSLQRRGVVDHPHQILHGSTILFKRELWVKHRFPEWVVGEDTGFEKEIFDAGAKLYIADPFNYIYCRREVSDHTYKIDVKTDWKLWDKLGPDEKIVFA